MLHFTRWKALAIALASAIICLLMLPSLLSDAAMSLPARWSGPNSNPKATS